MTVAFVLGPAQDYAPAAALIAGARERDIPVRVIAAGPGTPEDATLVEPVDVQVLLGEGSPVLRSSLALMGIENEIIDDPPEAVVVFGSHEAGLAAALIAAKEHIPLWHAGAGRFAFESTEGDGTESYAPPADEDLIAVLASGLLAPTEFAGTALAAARYDVRRIWVTGPLEAETLERMSDRIALRAAAADHDLEPRGYVAVSLENEDAMPGHPLPWVNVRGMGYLERISLLSEASVAVTDGFDLQLEACLLRVPCLVVAPSSPIREIRAVGAAKRCPADTASIALAIAEQAGRTERDWEAPPMFDADVSARILALIVPLDERRAAQDRADRATSEV
ncbi:MAG: UDP-N-acetylglucosamine 2-epimerase [Actinomycetota bacterium]